MYPGSTSRTHYGGPDRTMTLHGDCLMTLISKLTLKGFAVGLVVYTRRRNYYQINSPELKS
eukprot:4337798-Amphidinium_carterae.1